MNDWRRVEDELPGDEQVLGYFGEGSFQITYREKIRRVWYWMHTDGYALSDPTHWMPLPVAPDPTPQPQPDAVASTFADCETAMGMEYTTPPCACAEYYPGLPHHPDCPTRNADPTKAGQPERCCVDYPRCDCNSPPEPDDDWLCFRSPAQPKVTP
jgi:hypothetical protein